MKRDQVGLTALDLLLFSLERYCSSTPGNCSNVRASGNEGVEESCGAKKKRHGKHRFVRLEGLSSSIDLITCVIRDRHVRE